MKNKILIALASTVAILIAGVALAQVNPRTLGDIFGFRAVVITKGSGVSDPRAGALHIGRLNSEFPSTTHRITRMLRGSYTVDFTTQTATCGDSAAQTLTGARTGDLCVVSPPAASTANTMFNCRVSASNQVIVRFCPTGAGAVDPASGAYDVLVLSNAAP